MKKQLALTLAVFASVSLAVVACSSNQTAEPKAEAPPATLYLVYGPTGGLAPKTRGATMKAAEVSWTKISAPGPKTASIEKRGYSFQSATENTSATINGPSGSNFSLQIAERLKVGPKYAKVGNTYIDNKEGGKVVGGSNVEYPFTLHASSDQIEQPEAKVIEISPDAKRPGLPAGKNFFMDLSGSENYKIFVGLVMNVK